MNRKVLYASGAVVIAVVLFVGGALAGPQLLRSVPGVGTLVASAGAPGDMRGGPMANLTEEERTQLQTMSDSERQAFLQEKMGSSAPGGAGRAGGPGARVIEGEVLSVDAETLSIKTSAGGSQTVYVGSDTVVAYAKGVEQAEPAVGDSVTAVAQQESDSVLSASLVVVK